ncbi:type II/IV secretion system protein [Desulfovibrio psychrotolerans]|uniref:Type II/IV secretion system protein n=1 Tax=Desulfovibrio psychrotolerans TaxID=415242 RepID=A0A7J0BTF4_9BACT|nr:type II/IV secretion system protein [Desulfovibrio psychrotolerans]
MHRAPTDHIGHIGHIDHIGPDARTGSATPGAPAEQASAHTLLDLLELDPEPAGSEPAAATDAASRPHRATAAAAAQQATPGDLPPLSFAQPEAPVSPVSATLAAPAVTVAPAVTGMSKAGAHTDPQSPEQPARDESYYLVKSQIHERLIEMLDLTAVEALPPARLREEISRLVERLLREEFRQAPLNSRERRDILREVQDEVLGLGPLEPLLQDPTVSDILVNNYRQVYVERHGKLQRVPTRFKDDTHLRKIIDRIVAQVGRRVDEASPMVDARLLDGSRVNAIIPPLALDGPSLSIRRFSKDPLELDDLIRFNALTPEIGEVLKGIVRARLNCIVSGGTGSGKTTMLNCLSRFIPHDERIVTIEDAAELQMKQDHVVRLETRPANIEGNGEVNARDLVKNCLRMRPDRIIVGEVRSSEVLDMLQAMNTGHDGSLTTIHANNPRDCLMRLETMVAMAGLNIADKSLKRYIASAVDVIIQVNRLSDGSRKLLSLQEITGMEGDAITLQEIFSFKQTGIDENRKVIGQFVCTGIRPKFSARLQAQGIDLPPSLFDPTLREARQ